MQKRIGLDIRIFGAASGGIGRYCRELFPRVLEIDRQNSYFLFYNKKMVNMDELAVFKKFPNAKLVETGFRHYSLGEQVGYLRLLNKFNLDLVHFPNFNVPLLY